MVYFVGGKQRKGNGNVFQQLQKRMNIKQMRNDEIFWAFVKLLKTFNKQRTMLRINLICLTLSLGGMTAVTSISSVRK